MRKALFARRRMLFTGVILLLGCLIGLAVFAVHIDGYGQVDRAQRADAIVILGAGVAPDGEPGDSLRARTAWAVQLYRNGLAPIVICTGGTGDQPPAEAAVAARLALRLGVPEPALVLEDQSTSTFENARNTSWICSPQGWRRVVAVSDPYHLWRVQRDFSRVGITAYPSPARNCLRNRQTYLRVWYTIREVLLVLRDTLFPPSV